MSRSAKGRSSGGSSRFPRTARINEVLREVLAAELERHADDDPALELVTITGIDTDGDMKRAKVYFSALDTKATEEEVIASLERLRVGMQSKIGASVRMKRTPLLEFHPDPAITGGQRVEELLRDLNPDD